MSEKQYRDNIAGIKKKQATEEAARANARKAANKYRSDADKHYAKIKPTTSGANARSYERQAKTALDRADREDKKTADASDRLAKLERDLASAENSLEKAASSRKAESARKAADAKRQQSDRRHAREIGRLSSGTVRHVHEVRSIPAPELETLRVLYLTANPDKNLRTEAEVKAVQDEVRRALHRDRITVDYRPVYAAIAAAQPVQVAVDQGSVSVDLAGLDEGWAPQILARDDVGVTERVLVRVLS